MFFRSKSKPPAEAVPSTMKTQADGVTNGKAAVERSLFSLNDAPSSTNGDRHAVPSGDAGSAASNGAASNGAAFNGASSIGDADLAEPAPAIEGGGAVEQTDAKAALSGEDQKRNVERSRQFTLALGQITAVAIHSKQHQSLKLSELRSRVVPALLTGQFALASRRDERLGVQTPVTALLWASVSDAVDRRLSEGDGGELKLERADWRGGPHIWVVDVFGDQGLLPGLLRQLGEAQWSGKSVKMFVRDVDGRRVVRVIDKS